MSISGDLQDVSVAEVMQFVHLGRRTGTLVVHDGANRSEVGFHRGRIISAWTPRSKRLGQILVERGLIDQDLLDELLSDQESEHPRQSLGKLVVSRGHVDAAELRRVLGRQIEESVYELVTWRRGSFEFDLDELRPVDDIGVYPGDILPDINLDTQMVVLDALRIFDERNRRKMSESDSGDEAAPTAEPTAATEIAAAPEEPVAEPVAEPEIEESFSSLFEPAEGGEPPITPVVEPPTPVRLQVVTDEDGFVASLRESIDDDLASVTRVDLLDAGLTLPGESSPVVLIDLRSKLTLEDLAQLARSRPRATMLCLVDPWVAPARAYEAGALAALPPDPDAIAACLASVLRTRQGADGPGGPLRMRAGFARLRRVVADLRSGLLSATVALNLMQVISESVERAVMFLVRDDALTALGAFGFNADGQALANITSGLRFPISDSGALATAVDNGQTNSMLFEEAGLPPAFARLLGRPRTGQVVIFPVLGSTQVISVVYADNGGLAREIEEIEILELAAAQVGVAFENEMLRRRMRRDAGGG